MSDIKSLAENIKMVIFDVDGVLSNGEIVYTEENVEIKAFNCKDGQGIAMLSKFGIKTGIITARKSNIIIKRAEDLDMTEVYQGSKNKLESLNEILKKYNLDYSNIAYVGDDLPDLCVLRKVALACCPADAVSEVKKVCNFISSKNGGQGAVREVIDFIVYNNKSAFEAMNKIFGLEETANFL